MAKALRFKDTPTRSVKLKKSDKIVFFAPHTSEQPAVAPLISKLTEKLKKEGKEVKKETIDDMRLRVLRTTSQLSEKNLSGSELELVEKLFRLEDTWVRLQKIGELMEKNPDAVILEVHALDKDYQEDSEFRMVDYFQRLPGTRVLVLRDIEQEYTYPILDGLAAVDGKKERHLAIVGLFSEFVLKKVAEENRRLLETLSRNTDRIAMIEIPAPSYFHVRRTGVKLIDGLILRLANLPPHLTRFEEAYGINSSDMATITEADVQGILRMLL